MNTAKNIKIFYMTARIILALITLLALFTLYMWKTSPDSVNSFGKKYILEAFEAEYINKLSTGQNLVKNNKSEEAFLHFTSLLNDMKEVERRDRLHRIKKEVFLTTIKLSKKLNKKENTITLLNSLINYDDKDIDFALLRIQSFLNYDSHKIEGEISLEKLYIKFPNLNNVAKLYAQLLANKGELAKAFQSYYGNNFINFSRNGMWILAYHNGNGFGQGTTRRFSVKIDNKRIATASSFFPPNTKEILIDSPKFLGLQVLNGAVIIENETEMRIFKFDNRNSPCKEFRNINTCNVVTPGSPFFVLRIPTDFDTSKGLNFQISTKINKTPFKGLSNIISNSKSVSNELKRNNDNTGAKLLEELSEYYKSELNVGVTRQVK